MSNRGTDKPEYSPLPWRSEFTDDGHLLIFAADGGVLVVDDTHESSGDVGEYIVHCVNGYDDLAARLEQTTRERDALLATCEKAHELLYHYDLVQQPNGVDWGPAEQLRADMVAMLWYALVKAGRS